jgi:ABC-type sugar transport system substrate-binding protein
MAKNLDSGKVAIIEGQLGRGDAEAYTQGFMAGLKNNPKLQVVAKSPGDWNRQKAHDIASSFITAHPDLKGLFVANEDMAVGAVLALERAGKLKQVTVVAMNGAPYGLDLIKKGKLALTNANPPSIASVYSLRLLLGVIRGQVKPGQFYWAPTMLINKMNVDKAVRWDAPASQVKQWVKDPLPKPVVPAP